jgi:hypothetical protein
MVYKRKISPPSHAMEGCPSEAMGGVVLFSEKMTKKYLPN